MKIFSALLCLLLSACASSTPTATTKLETVSCQTSGVCDYSKYNPKTKRFENFNGAADACPGTMTREVKILAKGGGGTEEFAGPWSACKLK
jgi:hypothetical protein